MPPTGSTSSTATREIAAIVVRLLAHYWTADDPPQTRQAQIEDWLIDLREFGPAIVAEACQIWRRTQARRPTPADIRRLCIAAAPASVPRIAGPAWSETEFRRAADAWAREHGHADWAAAEQAGCVLFVQSPNGEVRRLGRRAWEISPRIGPGDAP